MTPAAIVQRAAEAGIKFRIGSSGRLSLLGKHSAVSYWLDVIRENKDAVLVQLQAEAAPWAAEDWIAYYDERAGIAEYDGGLPRGEAEALAYTCCVAEWLNHNPAESPPGCCLGCGESECADDLLLPFGTETTGYAWLHNSCWGAWYTHRKDEAAAALLALGIHYRSSNP